MSGSVKSLQNSLSATLADAGVDYALSRDIKLVSVRVGDGGLNLVKFGDYISD